MGKYKKGTRLRATWEGVITDQDGDYLDVNHWCLPLEYAVSIEKLPDPEPEWVDGAAVKIPGFLPAVWEAESGHWYGTSRGSWPMDRLVSDSWNEGTLKILWNGDE